MRSVQFLKSDFCAYSGLRLMRCSLRSVLASSSITSSTWDDRGQRSEDECLFGLSFILKDLKVFYYT